MSARIVHSPKEAIDALGGVVFVASLFGIGRNAVSNWYRRGFPPEAYSILAPRLKRAGCKFSPDLFRQYRVAPPEKPRKRKANGGRR